jgi:hypothetical protein
MKYLCLIYVDQGKWAALSLDEHRALAMETSLFNEELCASGRSLGCTRLQPIETASTVRVGVGGPIVTDGPYAETKEHLGGYLLLDARDMNDAIRLAAKFPPARYGCVEVRPVLERSLLEETLR